MDLKEKKTSSSSESAKGKGSMVGTIAMGVIIVVLAIASMYFFVQYQKIKKNPEIITKQETEALVEAAGKLIDLPKDETPTIATVLDKNKLKDQPFFANAQNGDKIIIYTKAKKAIVYRPKDNKLINVGPISIDQKAAVGVALVDAGGDTASIQKTLTDKLGKAISIVSTTSAKSARNVKALVVVDVSGQNAEAAKQVADAIGGTVGSLPTGETAPDGAAIAVFVK